MGSKCHQAGVGLGDEGWDCGRSRVALRRRLFRRLRIECAAAGGVKPTEEKTFGLLPYKL